MTDLHDGEIKPAAQPQTPIDFDVPDGACDTLTHIFGEPAQFPMATTRTYTPPPASVGEIQRMLAALHFTRVVIVQPTIYASDNSCTVDAVRRLGPGARAVAVVDETTPPTALDQLASAGIRGLRVNMETIGQADPAIARRRFQAAMKQVEGRDGWHIQMYARPAMLEAVADLVAASSVPVSLDHFAGFRAADGTNHPVFRQLLDFVRTGRVYVKLSAPYLASSQGPDFPDLAPLAAALVAANPERILWATNWPHPNSGKEGPRPPFGTVMPLRQPDDGHILNLLARWVPDPAVRHAVLVDNPARLFGF